MTIDKAKSYLSNGEVAAAREHLLGLVDDGLGSNEIWLLVAGIAIRSEDWALGLRAFSELVRLRPRSALASSGLAKCLSELSMRREVLDEIDRFSRVADVEQACDIAVLEEHESLKRRIDKLLD